MAEEKQKEPEKTSPVFPAGHVEPSASSAPAPLEGEVLGPPEILHEKPSLVERLEDFFHHSNISLGAIARGAACIVLVPLLAWAGIVGYRYAKNRWWSASSAVPQKPSVEISADQTGIPSVIAVGRALNITSGFLGEIGLTVLSRLGDEYLAETGLAQYIFVFSRLQNVYDMDINRMLDASSDRRGRLESYLTILKNLFIEAQNTRQKIGQEMALIISRYNLAKAEQDAADKNFFGQLRDLNPQSAQDLLAQFIDVSRDVVALRARFKALQKLASFFDQAIPKVERRIRDIELNIEPLVAGLKVYDVKGSDLKLIIPTDGGVTTQEESLSSSAFPFIPIQSVNAGQGKDWITQPGTAQLNSNK